MKRKLGLLGFGLMVAGLIGCGGGGSTSSPSGGSRSPVAVFVTDAPGNYDHVWVTIKKVEVSGGTSNVTLFEDANGRVVDLASLNQGGRQKFALLGVGSAVPGSYTQVRVTLADNLVVFPRGSSLGMPKQFEEASGGIKTLAFPVSAGAHNNLVADFDVSRWEETGNVMRAVVASGNAAAIGDDVQAEQELEGNVSHLSGAAPTFEFDLSRAGSVTHVTTDLTTSFANADGSQNPNLTNGAHVHVTGSIDATTHVVTATSVVIRTGEDGAEAEAKGTVSSVTTDGFALDVSRAKGFVPTSTTITIATTTNTVYMSDNGIGLTKDEFFAGLAAGAQAEAEGTFDAATNVLTATRLSSENEIENENEGHKGVAKIIGGASSIDATAKTFSVTVQKWEGTILKAGDSIRVVTTATTDLRDVDFATLTDGATLEVRGILDGTTLTATRIRNRAGGGGGSSGGSGGHGGDD